MGGVLHKVFASLAAALVLLGQCGQGVELAVKHGPAEPVVRRQGGRTGSMVVDEQGKVHPLGSSALGAQEAASAQATARSRQAQRDDALLAVVGTANARPTDASLS